MYEKVSILFTFIIFRRGGGGDIDSDVAFAFESYVLDS
jgi:hypothetical protein